MPTGGKQIYRLPGSNQFHLAVPSRYRSSYWGSFCCSGAWGCKIISDGSSTAFRVASGGAEDGVLIDAIALRSY